MPAAVCGIINQELGELGQLGVLGVRCKYRRHGPHAAASLLRSCVLDALKTLGVFGGGQGRAGQGRSPGGRGVPIDAS